MAAPPLTNNFDGGTNTTVIDASNSGGTSGDIFDAVVGSPTFTNVQAHSGALSARWVDATSTEYMEWQSLGSLTSAVYFRWYMYLTAYPTTNRHYTLRLLTTGSAATCAYIRIMADATGHMSAADASQSGVGAEGAVGISLNQWVRMEAKIVPSTTVGQIEWRLYNSPESSTITDSVDTGAALVLGANIDVVRWGVPVLPPATPYTFYMDDLAVSTTDWIGPTQIGKVAPTSFLSGVGW